MAPRRPSPKREAHARRRYFGAPRLHLAVGPFASDGSAFHEVVLEGVKLAETRSEGTRAIWNIRSQPSFYVVRTLYRLSGEPHFAVHAVLYSRQGDRPQLARFEAYPELAGVAVHHPDLAREHRGSPESGEPDSPAPLEAVPTRPAHTASRAQ